MYRVSDSLFDASRRNETARSKKGADRLGFPRPIDCVPLRISTCDSYRFRPSRRTVAG